MASRFQAATLVGSPSYPNSIAWSQENLVAVASGHIVTILNPASLAGPRGLITVSPSRPFAIGLIEKEDLFSGCLLPICLSRDSRPCIRSISWSPLGLAPNYGCLLAVCTTDGRVKVYRPPFYEFSAEWVELIDLSDMLLDHLMGVNFGGLDSSLGSAAPAAEPTMQSDHEDLPIKFLKRESKRKRANNVGGL